MSLRPSDGTVLFTSKHPRRSYQEEEEEDEEEEEEEVLKNETVKFTVRVTNHFLVREDSEVGVSKLNCGNRN